MGVASTTLGAVRAAGHEEKVFRISMGSRFLELFSENLYSSPNKAFEELVANSWDAEATAVYISIPDDLSTPDAAVWVLDNGISMDADGLETLWKITSPHKRKIVNPKRPQIGKFGIGKLATYILASEITFICKASDGRIRTVPFDYRDIDDTEGEVWDPDKVPLSVRVISETELTEILSTVEAGPKILGLISDKVPVRKPDSYNDEFHHPDPPPIEASDTWTLVLLTSLREVGRSIQRGRIRRMLRSALPLTSDVSIILNDEVLEPSKIDAEAKSTWVLGTNLDIDELEVDDVDSEPRKDSVKVQQFDDGLHPYITIDGIKGRISGQITLYDSRISGGKSESLGASNGFFVNILGRVINTDNTDFGLENLSHSTWSQFRATIRADGLDSYLGVERDGLRESRTVRIFKKFLMATFNKARTALNESRAAEWPRAGDVLDGSWKSIPMKPLAEVVLERLEASIGLPSSFEWTGGNHFDEVRDQWTEAVKENPGELISKVKSMQFGQQLPFSKYDLSSREFLVNEGHPYFVGRSGTVEERLVLQDFALVNFLTELYLIRNNVDSVTLDEGRAFRDELLRILAQLECRTGAQITNMLQESRSNPTGLEVIVGEALNYLGFNVKPLASRGDPDGIAVAPLTPNIEDPGKGSYSFSYDAKSTIKENGRVSNEHVRPGTLKRHRKEHGADHTLVVAPDFELGALQAECQNNKVTPMRSEDLGHLLVLSAVSGTIDFIEFRGVFNLYDPDEVHTWVENFVSSSKAKPHISVGQLIRAFEEIGIEGPDELETSVIADRMRSQSGNDRFPTEIHIRRAVEGLGVFLPSIVRNNNKQVYLSASPKDIRRALLDQLQLLPESIQKRIGSDF